MLTRIHNPKDDREAGFTLIELLVVVAIIGILAAIAIPVFLSQRNSAREASIKADLNATATQLETWMTQYNTGMPTTAVTTGNVTGANFGGVATELIEVSNGNLVTVVQVGKGYNVFGCNTDSLTGYSYFSDLGGLSATSTTLTACTPNAVAQWGTTPTGYPTS